MQSDSLSPTVHASKQCVVVLNPSGPISLRHIISLREGEKYDQAAFKVWYYGIYHKLDGDEFHFCAGNEERDAVIARSLQMDKEWCKRD